MYFNIKELIKQQQKHCACTSQLTVFVCFQLVTCAKFELFPRNAVNYEKCRFVTFKIKRLQRHACIVYIWDYIIESTLALDVWLYE